jgi:hemolysin III
MPWPDFAFRDPVSSITHLSTALAGLFVTALLWRLARGDRGKRLSLACFGACIVVLYATSGVYHAIPLPKQSPPVELFRRLNHSAIYVLIAGTYTPVFAVLLAGAQRRRYLIGIWSLAAVGVAAKWLFRVGTDPFSVGLYLAMGWIGLMPLSRLRRVIGWRGIAWGFAGGLAYTAGAIFEMLRWPVFLPGVVGYHEVFHVCDMLGTALHVGFMVQCVIPYRNVRLSQLEAATATRQQAA